MTNWQEDTEIPEPLKGKKKRGREAARRVAGATGHHLTVLNHGAADTKLTHIKPSGKAGQLIDSHGMVAGSAVAIGDVASLMGTLSSLGPLGTIIGIISWGATGTVALLWVRKAHKSGRDKVPARRKVSSEHLDADDDQAEMETVVVVDPGEGTAAPVRAASEERAEADVVSAPVDLDVTDAVRTPGTEVFGDMSAVSPVFDNAELRQRILSEQEDITQMFRTARILSESSKKNPEGQSVVLLKPKEHDGESWTAYLWLPEGVGVGTVRARLNNLATSQLDTIPQKIFVQQIPGEDSERKIVLRVFNKLPFTGDPVAHPLLAANNKKEGN